MTIHDYAELVIEAAERAGQGGLPARSEMLVGMLERYLNKQLRTKGQEVDTPLTTDATGSALVPTDLLEIKGVYYRGRRVPRLTYSPIEHSFAGWGYYTDGDSLKSTLKSREVDLRYYRTIPGLHANDTNWLLTAEPEIYLQGTLWQAFLRSGEYDKASAAKAYMDDLIAELVKADRNRRRGLAKLDMTGDRYECGDDFTVRSA